MSNDPTQNRAKHHDEEHHDAKKHDAGHKTHDLVVTRVFDALVEDVWNAWTDGKLVTQWWGPKGASSITAEMDVREGGSSLLGMQAGHGHQYTTWHYRTIETGRRLDFTASVADKNGGRLEPAEAGLAGDYPQDQHHSVVLKALGERETEVFVTQHGWPAGATLELGRATLEQCLDKMAVLFAN